MKTRVLLQFRMAFTVFTYSSETTTAILRGTISKLP